MYLRSVLRFDLGNLLLQRFLIFFYIGIFLLFDVLNRTAKFVDQSGLFAFDSICSGLRLILRSFLVCDLRKKTYRIIIVYLNLLQITIGFCTFGLTFAGLFLVIFLILLLLLLFILFLGFGLGYFSVLSLEGILNLSTISGKENLLEGAADLE